MPSQLEFLANGVSASGKTRVWIVACRGSYLGQVSWYAQWRKYVFFPNANTLYDSSCLIDIADFCSAQTKMHKEKKNARHQ